MQESQRPDARGKELLIYNARESGRVGGMIPLVKYLLHIELWIIEEPGLMPLVNYFQYIKI